MRAAPWPTALRAGWGATLLLAPSVVLALTSPARRHDATARTVLRVLGARHLGQAAVVARWPRPLVRRIGVLVDGLHAASGVGLALLAPEWRPNAALDVVVTVGLASTELTVADR